MRETEILHQIRQALASEPDLMILRNNVGVGQVFGGGAVRFGVGVGSPDLVGILAPRGRLVGFEIKTATGRLSRDQQLWHNAARNYGAFVCVVRSVPEAMRALDRARAGHSQ